MKTIGPLGKVVDFPGVSHRVGATIGPLRMAQDLIVPRLRRTIFPPVLEGQTAQTGDALLALTDGGQNTFITTGSANISAQEDSVGFMFGTALRSPSKGSIRGLFQDGKERTLIDKDRQRLGERLFVFSEGINYFVGDEVIIDIHTDDRRPGTIVEILESPDDTALVAAEPAPQPPWLDVDVEDWLDLEFDDDIEIVTVPFRHMVLTGPGIEVPQINSDYNISDIIAELELEASRITWLDLPLR